jgi:hypothetical protein
MLTNLGTFGYFILLYTLKFIVHILISLFEFLFYVSKRIYIEFLVEILVKISIFTLKISGHLTRLNNDKQTIS